MGFAWWMFTTAGTSVECFYRMSTGFSFFQQIVCLIRGPGMLSTLFSEIGGVVQNQSFAHALG